MTDRSIFSIDAIQADKDFYTKAVLEHHFINQVFRDFSVEDEENANEKHLYAVHKNKKKIKQNGFTSNHCEFTRGVPREKNREGDNVVQTV